MKSGFFFIVLTLSFAGQLLGAASSSSRLSFPTSELSLPTILTVGGQNALGSEAEYVSSLFQVPMDRIVRAQLPQGWCKDGIDLGQGVCVEHLSRDFPASGDVAFHATSQGTASTLNFVSQLSQADQARIRVIVLEAVLASGNSAIIHNAKDILGSSAESEVCYYSAPYSATFMFPRYSPSGMQPIKSIAHISREIPIVIVHSKEDGCLPYSGACALYYGLRAQGHENVYFISCEGRDHIQVLESKPIAQMCLRKILEHHRVFKVESDCKMLTPGERTLVQPEIEQYREFYEQLYSREQKHSYLPWVAGTVAVGGALFLAKPKIVEFCTKRGIDSLGSLFSSFKWS
jgi:hypothetical protein